MNILNAFAAYGVNNQSSTTNGAGLEAALNKIGGDRSSAKTNKTDSFSTVEATFSVEKDQMDSAQTSDIYEKNLNGDNAITEEAADNRTEAEKNQDKMEDSANKITPEDMEELINEGFDVFGMTPDELSAAVDRLKLQKEMFETAIENQIETKVDNRAAVIAMAVQSLGSNPNAERIAEKLIKANLPVTEANLTKIAAALDLGGNETTVSGAEAEYLIRNKLTPTLENIAEARSSASAYTKKEKTLSEEAWNQLQPTVSHLLFQAGLRQSKDLMSAAQDFIKKDIPLTAENLKAYAQLTKIKLNDEEILTRSVDAISVGQDPKSANLLSSSAKQVRQIIQNNDKVSDQAIDYAVAKKAAQTGEYSSDKIELSLGELHEAQNEVENKTTVPSYLEEYSNSGAGQAASIKARRQLEEVKAKMTYEAGYRLAKEGIRIDAVSMNRLINDLKTLENRYYSDFFRQAGVKAGGYSQSDVDMLRDTTERLREIENMPATLVYDTVDKANNITLNEIYTEGNAGYNRAFNMMSQTMETVMTAPSGKYGDSIEKAFANVDSLLTENGIELTDRNRRAARILGYARADITADNISKVAEYDEKLQTTLSELRPSVTVRLIRDGINPLNESLDNLNGKIEEIKNNEGISSEDNFSNFLVNLDRRNELTTEEREAYLAIYRALHQIKSSDEAAVGQVFKAGEEPSLQKLLTAVRSGRFLGNETVINDTFENLTRTARDVDRIENKIRAGLSKPLSEEGELLNKLVEDADNTIKELSEDVKLTAKEWVENIREIAANGTNATRFLEDFNILTTVENIDVAKDILKDDNQIYKDWKRFKTMATGETGILPDLVESLTGKEEMQEAYASFLDETKEIKQALQHDPAMKKLDVKALKKMDVAAKLMNRLSKREFYRIPIDTGDEIVSMNVTLMNDAENDTSKVFVSMPTANLGQVTCEATLENNRMKCFIKSSDGQGMAALKEKQLNLFAGLAENGIQIGSIFYGAEEVSSDKYDYKTSGLYKDVPEGESAGSTSNELYRIARVFVTHVREADV